MKAFLNNEESLESAVAKVSEEDKRKHARDVACKFREFLTNSSYVAQLMEEDEEFQFEMNKIITRLNKLNLH